MVGQYCGDIKLHGKTFQFSKTQFISNMSSKEMQELGLFHLLEDPFYLKTTRQICTNNFYNGSRTRELHGKTIIFLISCKI